jgi:hypothetical protein
MPAASTTNYNFNCSNCVNNVSSTNFTMNMNIYSSSPPRTSRRVVACGNPLCRGTASTVLCDNACGRHVHMPSEGCGSTTQHGERLFCYFCGMGQSGAGAFSRRDDYDYDDDGLSYASAFSSVPGVVDANFTAIDDIVLEANSAAAAVASPGDDDSSSDDDEIGADELARFFGENLAIDGQRERVIGDVPASGAFLVASELQLSALQLAPVEEARVNGATVNVRQSADARRTIFATALGAANDAFGMNKAKGMKAFARSFGMYEECRDGSFAANAFVATSKPLPTPREKSVSDEFVRLCEVEWRARKGTGPESHHFMLNDFPTKPVRATKARGTKRKEARSSVGSAADGQVTRTVAAREGEIRLTVSDAVQQVHVDADADALADDDDDDDDEGSGADLGGYEITSGAPSDSAAHANITIGSAAELLVDVRKHRDDKLKQDELLTKFCIDFKRRAHRRRSQRADELPKCQYCGRDDIFSRPPEAVQRHIESCRRRVALEQQQ